MPVLQNLKRKTVSPTTTPPPANILRKIKRYPVEPPSKFVGICDIFRDNLVWLFRFVTQIKQEIRSFFADWAECLHGYLFIFIYLFYLFIYLFIHSFIHSF